jgi:FkbM family methyltransferase
MIIVQIGCHDGNDHVLDFCLKNRRDIKEIHLVEPNPEALKDCRQSYSNFQEARFYNLAIVGNHLKSIDLHIPKIKSFNSHASTIPSHLAAHKHQSFKTIKVKASTLANFFDANKLITCDRLYMDTEGLDSDIVLSLDFMKYKIKRIEFEVIHADGPFRKSLKYFSCIKKLMDLGYRPTNASVCTETGAQYNKAFRI